MAQIKMQIEKRTDKGTNAVSKMRAKDSIPGVLYSRGKETVLVSIDKTEFVRVYKKAGSTSLLDLKLGDQAIPAIIKEIQRHPYKNEILHVDLQELNMTEKIKIIIPIVLLNRDNIQVQPSVLMQQIDEIEVECLPGNIPNTAEADVANLKLNDNITIADLDIAKDEDITILEELDTVVCTLTEPSYDEEDEESEVDDEVAEPELIGEDDDEGQEEEE